MMQISSLKQQLTAAAEHEMATVDELKRDHQCELQQLRDDMMKAADEYSNKVRSLELSNRNEIDAINEQHQRQLKVAGVSCSALITVVWRVLECVEYILMVTVVMLL